MSNETVGDYSPPDGAGAGLNFKKPYTPPPGSGVGLGFRFVWYHPPAGNLAGLNFSGAYTPPAGNRVGIDFTNDPDGGEDKSTQFVFPGGWNAIDYGAAGVELYTHYFAVGGWLSAKYGTPAIRNLSQAAMGAGATPPRNGYGTPNIWIYTRYLAPPGADAQLFGTQWASHWLRYIAASGVGDKTARGEPWVSRSPRSLEPAGPDMMRVFASLVVGGTRFLCPVGAEMTQWGSRIIPEGQVAYPSGFVGEVGGPDARLHTRYLQPSGFKANPDDLRFGRQDAWNLRQIIEHGYDTNDGLNPPGFGQWMGIENRNKEPVPVGWLSERHGYTSIVNKATAVLPAGMAPTGGASAGAVTHKHRPLALEGFDAQGFSGWHVVSNNADLLRPPGASTQEFGRLALENRSRQYQGIGNMDTAVAGTPMVAPAVRGIAFEQRYSIEPPAIPLPEVKLHTRYVEYVSAGERLGTGVPSLSIHWTIIEPKWAFHPPAWIGEPALRNVTPELRTGGANHEDFGAAAVRTQWRSVETQGADAQQFGQATARDRRSWVFTAGMIPPVMLPGPVVTKVGGMPDPQQIIVGGIAPQAIPTPTLNIQSAKPSGPDLMRFGAAVVRANSVRVEPGIFDHYFGQPAIGLKRRVLDVDKKGIPGYEMGTFRVSPHTIYAVVEAPLQAIENHELRLLHYVDHDVVYNQPLTGPGTPAITHRARSLTADDIRPPDMDGLHTIVNRRITVSPTGVQALRMGMVMTNGPQSISVDNGARTLAVGTAKVVRAPYTGPQVAAPQGVPPPAIVGPYTDFKDRALYPVGLQAMALGASKPGDTPYQWQGLRVGPLVPTIPHGFDAQQFGVPWVSLRVRDVALQGFDVLEVDYEPQNFHKRMRVANATTPRPPTQRLTTVGVAPPVVLGHSTRMGRHYIRPDGNSDQYRKGAL